MGGGVYVYTVVSDYQLLIANTLYMKLKTLIASGAALALIATVAASPMLVSAKDSPKSEKTSGTSVAIGTNGGVLVRGAEVTAVSGNTVTARTQWGDTNISWTVETDGETNFIDRGGDKSERADIGTGETISFSGYIDADSGTFSVDADVVRNWSEGEKHDNRSDRAEVKTEVSGKNFWKDLGLKFTSGFNWGNK